MDHERLFCIVTHHFAKTIFSEIFCSPIDLFYWRMKVSTVV